MKIILVSGAKKNWYGGASSVFLNLERQLKSLSVHCQVYHAEDVDGSWPPFIVRIFRAWLTSLRVYEAAKVADVVEVSGGLGWLLFRRLRKLPSSERPLLVVRLHGLEYKDEQARVSQWIARTMKLSKKYLWINRHWINYQEFESLRLADVVAVYTTRELDGIVVSKLKAESQVSVIPLGTSPEFAQPHYYPPKATRLLWWGSWVERKGIADLPRAFALALKSCPDLTLSIGGTGIQSDQLLSMFEPQCRERIEVLPFVPPDAHINLLRTHDVFLFPSLSEGFGLALLEAMSAGLPCITSLTGMYDWLEHRRNCYVVPMNAPSALAAAIEALYLDADLRQTIGQNAALLSRDLTWEKFAQGSLNLYRSAPKIEI